VGPGEVIVTCTVYTDMCCRLIVLKSNSEKLLLTTPKLSGILGGGAHSPGRNIHARFDFNRRLGERPHSPDLDFAPILGIGRRSLIEQGDSVCSSSGISDSDDESKGNESSSFVEEANAVRVVQSQDRLHEDENHISIFVFDYEFRPNNVAVNKGTEVCFVFDGRKERKISCDPEFRDVCLDANSKTFIHIFNDVGEFVIENMRFPFVNCRVFVKEDNRQYDQPSYTSPALKLPDDELPRPPMVTLGQKTSWKVAPPSVGAVGAAGAFRRNISLKSTESPENAGKLLSGFQKTNFIHSKASISMKLVDQLMDDCNLESHVKSVDVESSIQFSQLRPASVVPIDSPKKSPTVSIFGKIVTPKLKGSFPEMKPVNNGPFTGQQDPPPEIDSLDLMEMQPLAVDKKKKTKKKKKKKKSQSLNSAEIDSEASDGQRETNDILCSLAESAKYFHDPDSVKDNKIGTGTYSTGELKDRDSQLGEEENNAKALPSWESRSDRYRSFINPKFRSTGRESPLVDNDETSTTIATDNLDLEISTDDVVRDNTDKASLDITDNVTETNEVVLESFETFTTSLITDQEFLSMDDFVVVDKKKKKVKAKRDSQDEKECGVCNTNIRAVSEVASIENLDLSFEEELRLAISLSKSLAAEEERRKSAQDSSAVALESISFVRDLEIAMDVAKLKASEILSIVENERLHALDALEVKSKLRKTAVEAEASEKMSVADKEVLRVYAKADEELVKATAEAVAKAEAIKAQADRDAEEEITRASKRSSQIKAKAEKRALYTKAITEKNVEEALGLVNIEISEEKISVEKSLNDRIIASKAAADAAVSRYEKALLEYNILVAKEAETKADAVALQMKVQVETKTEAAVNFGYAKSIEAQVKRLEPGDVVVEAVAATMINQEKKPSSKKNDKGVKVNTKSDQCKIAKVRTGSKESKIAREEINIADVPVLSQTSEKQTVQNRDSKITVSNVAENLPPLELKASTADEADVNKYETRGVQVRNLLGMKVRTEDPNNVDPETIHTISDSKVGSKETKSKTKSKMKVIQESSENKSIFETEKVSVQPVESVSENNEVTVSSTYQIERLLCQRMDNLQNLIDCGEEGILIILDFFALIILI